MADLYREPADASPEMAGSSAPLNSAELEIAELEKQLAQKRAMLGAEKPLEKIIGAEKPSPSAVVAPVAPAASTPVAPPEIKPEAQGIKDLEKDQQVKKLVDLAFQKGIAYAADVAKEMDSAYLIDEFHDTLVDELHKELVEKGKLEEI